MEIQPDFKELLELFNYYKVEYMIVGGYAHAFHGAPRYTGDMDIFVLLTGPVSRLEEHRIIMSKIYDLVLDLERPIHAKPVDIVIYNTKEYPLYQFHTNSSYTSYRSCINMAQFGHTLFSLKT